MRIKRFIAPDMRTALRMVRDEQGPDAVILSNRPCEDGVEVVCATDYDEALVQQALRAAAPKVMPVPTAAPSAPNGMPAAPVAETAAAAPPRAVETASQKAAPSVRETLANRARAVFRIGDAPAEASAEPTLAQLTGAATKQEAGEVSDRHSREGGNPVTLAATDPTASTATSPQKSLDRRPSRHDEATRLRGNDEQKPQSRFDEMMEALNPVRIDTDAANVNVDTEADTDTPELADDIVTLSAPTPLSPSAPSRPAGPRPDAPPAADVAEPVAPAPAPAPSTPETAAAPAGDETASPAAPAPKLELSLEPAPELEQRHAAEQPESREAPNLQVVPRWDADPTVAAMREELAAMRSLIEREMGQFTVERLRGSPARAAAFDLLLGYGCDDNLAQMLAARIDAKLDPEKVRAPMLAEFARLLRIRRDEPIEDGGVIALIGPTGAGKTTTAAKLAARFAARHRARDVALVTTDAERVGAREQLHAHGRRLGITVSEAHGPEGLAQTLEQLRDYPLVIVDTAGYGARDRALLGQITWLRATQNVRSLLVLPANAHPHDMSEVMHRYRMASPEGVVLTKIDETGRLGAALSVLHRGDLPLAYTCDGQQVATDLSAADASHLVLQLEKLRRAADNPLATEDRHVVA